MSRVHIRNQLKEIQAAKRHLQRNLKTAALLFKRAVKYVDRQTTRLESREAKLQQQLSQ